MSTTVKVNKSFGNKVLKVVAGIPKGATLSYKEVAACAGSPRAWRAVGRIVSRNYDTKIPCHRVIRSDGKPGEYNRGSELKKNILRSEQVRPVQTGLFGAT